MHSNNYLPNSTVHVATHSASHPWSLPTLIIIPFATSELIEVNNADLEVNGLDDPGLLFNEKGSSSQYNIQ